jgi:predicted transcriptional regulator
MSMLSLRLPESLHRKVRELAEKESISINQFIATAVAEKMAALLTEEYLEERARRADPAAFDRILARVPDVPPIAGDEREPVIRKRPSNKRRAGRPQPASGSR